MKKIIVANWKMNPRTLGEAELIFKNLQAINKKIKKTEMVICPPFPFLTIYQKNKNKSLKLGAQNLHFEAEGSYTGEVSAIMLRSLKVEYVIVGHSERRALGETNLVINKKILNAQKAKLIPIVCIGEKVRDAEGSYLSNLKEQIREAFQGISKAQIKNIIIAYEPVWAIGQGAVREATVEEFVEIKIFIKKTLADLFDLKLANSVRIIFGGSVNPENAESFIKVGQADGLLVGRDSLVPQKFSAIVKIAESYEIN